MHCPAHSLKPVGHDPPQLVPSHVADPPIGTGQATQAIPQLATSVLLTHCPVQMCVPAPQIVPPAGVSAVDLSIAASAIEPPVPALPPSTFKTRPVLHACRPTMKKINWATARQSRALAWTNRRRRQTGARVMLSLRRRREKIPLNRRRRAACRAAERSSVTSMNLPSPPPWSPAQKHQTVAMGVRPVKSNFGVRFPSNAAGRDSRRAAHAEYRAPRFCESSGLGARQPLGLWACSRACVRSGSTSPVRPTYSS